ncbi:ead/Ea22-like family protein [Klebsiella pneumoniae subsp. ozaenae]|nr:ead/Ea22-like family protein [Klebsiella pneumoniae]
MTDITELAQSLKAAAEKATQGNWRAFQYHDGRCGIGGGHHDEIMVCEHISKERPHDAMFIALANPANVLALVEALEKAQQRIDELESRTVTAEKLQESAYRAGLTAGWNLGLDNNNDGFNKCLAAHAAGIKVEAE